MKYQIGGSLKKDAPSYIERKADSQIYDALIRGEFCYVFNSRQMGKSSLLVRTRARLLGEGFLCTTVDMTNIGSENVTPLQWYKGVVGDIWSGFGLSGEVNLKTWWQEWEEISLLQRLSKFISEVLLVKFPEQRLFIFIDEIDNILSLDFTVDDFFALIRYCYNQRAINPEYERITFAIFGVATPTDLIQNKKSTPFNIGKSIELTGFTLNESLCLAQGLHLGAIELNQAALQEILNWTEGQPFLTQKLCHLIANQGWGEGKEYNQINAQTLVSNIVESRIIQRWESQDEPLHLRTIRDRILNNDAIAASVLGTYQQILLDEQVLTDHSREKIELLLSGLVISQGDRLKVKNFIYARIFDLEWVAKHLDNLRPYSQSLNIWISSQQQDKSQLLTGIELQQAFAWSQNKQLSDIDYRFIAASQELIKQEISRDLDTEKVEKQKALFALQAAREASRILAEARKYAKRNVKQIRLGKRWILGITIAVAGAIILLRGAGVLQPMEWNMLDRFIQNRPSSGIDPRVVIITIDEPDLQQIGQYPIPDKVLAQALNKLKSYQPRNIGLDLYRDLPVSPGTEELTQIFKTTPNLIGIEKFVGSKVAPPPVLDKLGQVGLADQVLDGDGKVRRALLSVGSSKTKLRYNLSAVLAFDYLKAEGITPESIPENPYYRQLGKGILIPFRSNDGGYIRADAGGYQIILNYHGTIEDFENFSITDLLNDNVPPQAIKDKIVLIGSIAESINDLFQTPYSTRLFGPPTQMAGVTINANIVSQIISAAKTGRPMLRVWWEPIEWLWILLWSGIGAVLSWHWKSLNSLIPFILIAAAGLIAITYLLFNIGWWIPIIPPIFGLIVAAITLPIFTSRELEKIQLSQIVEVLLAIKEQPAVAQIAIEYLKQGESQENQTLIDETVFNISSKD
ncbi:putative transmembrane sensor domain protein [Rivularia sp. PCC 7116]|uniref:CHASE2 domain-containing protein n=1 Tax=Rivularia sp. PCC 7116 TaxID=373994 RepID=UPI00029F3BD8|nr:CHASE2 domain-containing protein [Rivularia sp. PCC 7116]AFY58669.1 putative transmembrane sensor domain protein [Rivularia sp. PCC 7116]